MTSQVRELLSHVPETELERVDRDGDLCVRCTPVGKMQFLTGGSNENEGGEAHTQLLRDAYDLAREIGLRLTIPNQDGTDTPDATAVPDVERYHSIRLNPLSSTQRSGVWSGRVPRKSRTTRSAD